MTQAAVALKRAVRPATSSSVAPGAAGAWFRQQKLEVDPGLE